MTGYFRRDLESSSVVYMPEYDFNVGRFIADHPDYCLRAGSEGSGFEAQKRDRNGRPVGERYAALTLDELAVMLARVDADI
jgi:hypothetical protein